MTYRSQLYFPQYKNTYTLSILDGVRGIRIMRSARVDGPSVQPFLLWNMHLYASTVNDQILDFQEPEMIKGSDSLRRCCNIPNLFAI